MVTQKDINTLNRLAKQGAPASYLQSVSKILDSKNQQSRSAGGVVIGNSSRNKPAPVLQSQGPAAPVQQPTATPPPSFFSAQGQSAAWQRTLDAYKLIGIRAGNALLPGEPFGRVDTSSSDLQGKATTFLTNPATLTVLPAIPAAWTLAGGGAATATTATTGSGVLGSLGSVKTALIAGVTGLGLGSLGGLFGGNKAAPQNISQQPNQNTNSTQTTNTTTIDNSYRPVDQRQFFTIKGSPNASIYGSQTATPTGQTTSVSPIQNTNPTQDTSANQSQETGTSSWWPLAIGALVAWFALRERK